jgi:hypothetical protein
MPARHDWYDWNSFEEAAAQAFWADTYISEAEELSEHREAYDALSPGPGGEWLNVLPDTPKSAEKEGAAFTKKIRAKLTTAELREVDSRMTVDKAGWYAAMQAMGHGVGWFDYGVDIDPDIDWAPGLDVRGDALKAIRRELREAGVRLPREAR